MNDFKKFHKGTVKKSPNFFLWALVSVIFILLGISAVLQKNISGREGAAPIEGGLAVLIGWILLIYGSFSLYHLFFKSQAIEESYSEYHDLDDFEENLQGYKTQFKIDHMTFPTGKGGSIGAYYYKLEITFNNFLFIGLNIRLRDKFEYYLWKFGLTRFNDVLTGDYYFDSRYRVKCNKKDLFLAVFQENITQQLANFDRDYPPIRSQNGTLIITDTTIKYIEGPYNNELRLFDPHRGTIESLFNELILIIEEIEKRLPESITHKNDLVRSNQLLSPLPQNNIKLKSFTDKTGTVMMWVMVITAIVYFIAKPFL